MTTSDERELLDEELAREVAAALTGSGIAAPDAIEAEALAGDLIAELRKRRIVLYRRAVHTLPPGLHQVTVDEVTGGSVLPEEPPAGSGATLTVGRSLADQSSAETQKEQA